MKILFQGDSITDSGRDYRNYHEMGKGYPRYAAYFIRRSHPELELEFINLGMSGNRTSQLFDRLYRDAIAFQPDIISILIGINDLWHRHDANKIATTDEQIELNYRSILKRLKKETNAKIVMLAPFQLDAEATAYLRDDLKTLLPIVRRLADEYADVYIPLDTLFEEALKTQPSPLYYSEDGVHPTVWGAEFIGRAYAEAVEPLLK